MVATCLTFAELTRAFCDGRRNGCEKREKREEHSHISIQLQGCRARHTTTMAYLEEDVPLLVNGDGSARHVPYIGGRQVMKQQELIWKHLPETRKASYRVCLQTAQNEMSPADQMEEFLSMSAKVVQRAEDKTNREQSARQRWLAINTKLLAKLWRTTTQGGSRWIQGGQSTVRRPTSAASCACVYT